MKHFPGATATATAAHGTGVFSLQEHAAVDCKTPLAARQCIEKTWSCDPNALVERLTISTPGLVFVTTSATNPDAPLVKVSGDTMGAVQSVQVLAPRTRATLQVSSSGIWTQGCLLIEICLPVEYALHSLKVYGSSVVVVEDRVLVVGNAPQVPVQLELLGSGDTFVTCQSALHVASLQLSLTGSGNLQVVAPSVDVTEKLSAKVTSSGSIRMFVGHLEAENVTASATGSGGLQFAALQVSIRDGLEATVRGSGSLCSLGDTFHAHQVKLATAGSGGIKLVAGDQFVVREIHSRVTGSGGITLAGKHAQCQEATYKTTGSGSMDARDVVVIQDAKACVTGSGLIRMRASGHLHAQKRGSGLVTVVGPMPTSVTGKAYFVENLPSQVESLLSKRLRPLPIPSREKAFEHPMGVGISVALNGVTDFLGSLFGSRVRKETTERPVNVTRVAPAEEGTGGNGGYCKPGGVPKPAFEGKTL